MPRESASGTSGPIRHAADARLAAALLALHSAVDGEAFWRAGLTVLQTAMPANHYVMALATVGTRPLMLRTTLPTPDEADYWERLCRVAPLEKMVARHVGRKFGRMSDDVPFLLLRLTPFYRQFMKPEGWRYSAALFFLDGSTFLGHFGQNRTVAQGDFSDAEMALLGELHPHFEIGVRRVMLFDRERSARLSLEDFMHRSPLATAVLDWELKPLYHNAAAAEASALWRLGPEAARALKPTFELPGEIGAVCREIGEARQRSILDGTGPAVAREQSVRHARLPWVQATVRLLDPGAAQFALPRFFVQFSILRPNGNPGADMQMLARLTPAQRKVALHAAQGLGNDEIAGQLAVSRSTVRTHLRKIFQVLGITSRGRLAPLARATPDPSEPANDSDLRR